LEIIVIFLKAYGKGNLYLIQAVKWRFSAFIYFLPTAAAILFSFEVTISAGRAPPSFIFYAYF